MVSHDAAGTSNLPESSSAENKRQAEIAAKITLAANVVRMV